MIVFWNINGYFATFRLMCFFKTRTVITAHVIILGTLCVCEENACIFRLMSLCLVSSHSKTPLYECSGTLKVYKTGQKCKLLHYLYKFLLINVILS